MTTLSEAVERVRDAVDTGVLGLQNRADLSLILAALEASTEALAKVKALANELSWNGKTRPIANAINLATANPAAKALEEPK